MISTAWGSGRISRCCFRCSTPRRGLLERPRRDGDLGSAGYDSERDICGGVEGRRRADVLQVTSVNIFANMVKDVPRLWLVRNGSANNVLNVCIDRIDNYLTLSWSGRKWWPDNWLPIHPHCRGWVRGKKYSCCWTLYGCPNAMSHEG